MTDRLKDGGPAFPREYTHKGHSGMSLRDWFAGQALAGLCANGEVASADVFAMAAYKMADAMLAAREGNSND
jgi:hypothetical protein